MQDYATRQSQFRRHGLGLGLVVLLHALLLWALLSGLGRTITRQAQVVVDAVLLSEDKPAPPPPASPLPAPPVKTPPPVPPTVAPPMVPLPPSPNAVTVAPAPAVPAVTAVPPAAAPAAPVSRGEPVRTAAGVNAANCEKPEYPSASRRLEEEGTVHLRFLVGVDGKVIQSEVDKSSGFKRLDEAARAGLAKCQFRPATVDGKPEQAWASIRYTWRLE